MDETVAKFSEYGLLGILLVMAGWTIRHLYMQLDERTKDFSEKVTSIADKSVEANKELLSKVESISEANRESHKEISEKYVALYEKTMEDFKDMHTKSIDAIIDRGTEE